MNGSSSARRQEVCRKPHQTLEGSEATGFGLF